MAAEFRIASTSCGAIRAYRDAAIFEQRSINHAAALAEYPDLWRAAERQGTINIFKAMARGDDMTTLARLQDILIRDYGVARETLSADAALNTFGNSEERRV